MLTPEDTAELKQKCLEAGAYLIQASNQLAGGKVEDFKESFANGSASFFYCRLILGFDKVKHNEN